MRTYAVSILVNVKTTAASAEAAIRKALKAIGDNVPAHVNRDNVIAVEYTEGTSNEHDR